MQNLMKGEAFSIVRNTTRGNGLEAWRKINRRFDPATGGSRKSLLRHVLAPPKLKLEELSAGIESWMDLIRRYEDCKDSRGEGQELPEDVKISILESMCPVEIERHLQLNRSRLDTFEQDWEELRLYLETRQGVKLKVEGVKDPDAMDVGGFTKGGKSKGKNKGKKGQTVGSGKGGMSSGQGTGQKGESRSCFNCGKPGHLQKDCWTPKSTSKDKGKGKKGGKGKSQKGGKGKFKKVGAVENEGDEQEWDDGYEEEDNDEPEKETMYLSLGMLDELRSLSARTEREVPDVGLPRRTRLEAAEEHRRLRKTGEERTWREEPISRYRQRLLAATHHRKTGKGEGRAVFEREGLDDACSSCHDRRKVSRKAAAAYATLRLQARQAKVVLKAKGKAKPAPVERIEEEEEDDEDKGGSDVDYGGESDENEQDPKDEEGEESESEEGAEEEAEEEDEEVSVKEELITEPATAPEEEEQEERDPEFPEVERPDDPEMRAALKRGEKKQKSRSVKTAKEMDDATDDGTITEFLMDEMPELFPELEHPANKREILSRFGRGSTRSEDGWSQ